MKDNQMKNLCIIVALFLSGCSEAAEKPVRKDVVSEFIFSECYRQEYKDFCRAAYFCFKQENDEKVLCQQFEEKIKQKAADNKKLLEEAAAESRKRTIELIKEQIK